MPPHERSQTRTPQQSHFQIPDSQKPRHNRCLLYVATKFWGDLLHSQGWVQGETRQGPRAQCLGPNPEGELLVTLCALGPSLAYPSPDPVSGSTETSVPFHFPAYSSLHVGIPGALKKLAPSLGPRVNVRQSLSAHASTRRSQRWDRLWHATVLSNQSRCQALCQGCWDRCEATLVDEQGTCNSEGFWGPFWDL